MESIQDKCQSLQQIHPKVGLCNAQSIIKLQRYSSELIGLSVHKCPKTSMNETKSDVAELPYNDERDMMSILEVIVAGVRSTSY